ncbi:MAG: SRPBCC domain-containing protein [Chloroflexi bacterium]|nr:SRPBCC domain-containing protein [Chloroflexota bacterium]
MSSKTKKPSALKFKCAITAPAAEVFRALTNPTALRDWLCNAAQSDPRPGGRLYLWWGHGYDVTGEYAAVEPRKKIVYTWNGRGDPAPTRVSVSLREKDGHTVVALTHGGLGSGKAWAEAAHLFEHLWEDALENLQSVVETGVDLRVARLPRLGIMVGDFNPDIAAQLRVPARGGIRLEGTFEGTGAHAAGLQKDDVMVSLGGKKVADFATLGEALQGHAAGDKVPVVFYRGGQKQKVTMELSRRPTPVYPATAAELADAARKVYADIDAGFAKLVEGVSEAEAERPPAPGEWSLKEAIAHFIACERDVQSWIAELINGGNNAGEAQDSLEFRPNVTPRLRVLVGRYPTVAVLLEELKRAEAETIALLAALPPEFVTRKHLYQRAAFWITQIVGSHFGDEHLNSMKAAIEAVKGN